MTTFHLRTLGGLSLHPGSPEEPPVLGASKPLAVLAYLALAPGRSARRSHLSELLWPGLPRRKARRALRQALYYLTKQAGTELWRADDGTVALAAEKLEVDAWALDRALEEERWADAAELYGGPFLAGFEGKGGTEFDHWAEAQHERLWAGVRAARHQLIEEALSGEGPEDADRAVRHARRCVELNPLDERAQEALVRAHLAAGDGVEAFRAYEAYRALLEAELGEEPGPELASRAAELRETLFDRRAEPEGAPVPPPSVPLSSLADDPALARPHRTGKARRRRYPWRSLAWVGTAAVLAAVLAGLGWRGVGGEVRAREATNASAEASADLLVTRAGGGVRGERGDSALRIRVGGEGPAAVTPVALPPRRGVIAPDGKRLAIWVQGPHGTDLAVRQGDGKLRRLTSGPADEWPQAWSPDGRRILYQYGDRRHGDSLFTTHLAVADAATGEVRRFPVAHPARADSQAVWSPTGTAVAFTGTEDGEAEVYVADADGRRGTDVSRAHGPDRHPAWSPGGRWLAFASRREGSWDIWLVRPDGTGLSRLTFSPEDETSPAWLSRREVAYVAERGGARDLWAVDVTTRSARRLTRRGDLERVRDVGRPGARTGVDRVEIKPRWKTLSPGQRVDFEARVLDAAGRRVPPAAARLRWRSSDTSVVRIDGEGRARAAAPGEAVLTVSAGGWRADTLRVASRELTERPRPVLLSEDWTGGIGPGRWIPAGDPRPEVVRGEGPSGAAFLNDGDENYDSGVLSRKPVPLQDGVSLEWWARLPFTGRHFQDLIVGLTTDSVPRLDGAAPPHAGVLHFAAAGVPRRVGVGTAMGGARRHEVPLPDDPAAWHRYGLELRPDGSVLYLLDGRLVWRSRPGFVGRIPDEARLVVGGRSLGTRVLAGPVTAWRGARWALAGGP